VLNAAREDIRKSWTLTCDETGEDRTDCLLFMIRSQGRGHSSGGAEDVAGGLCLGPESCGGDDQQSPAQLRQLAK